MKPNSSLSKNELARLDGILSKFSDVAGYDITYEGLISDWRRFVKEIRTGYRHSIYDYSNELSGRDLLENLKEAADDPVAKKIHEELLPLDADFEKNTQAVEKPLAANKVNGWWHRIPKQLVGELRDDLQDRGYSKVEPSG
jgi:hypothetical protein